MIRVTCKDWLKANRYEDVAALIELAEAKMAARGSKQRRDWWKTLAGGMNGRPLVVERIEFPVLRAAQVHEDRKITPNAICRNANEDPPTKWQTGRWPRKKQRKRRGSHSDS